MSKTKTDKSKYRSKYNDEYCTIRQYICDILMERQYKEKLPFKYWSVDKYKKKYTKNLQMIHKYCKLYDEQAILNVLLKKDWIYSFFYPKFWELVEKEEASSEQVVEPVTVVKTEKSDIKNKKNRVINRFKELDD